MRSAKWFWSAICIVANLDIVGGGDTNGPLKKTKTEQKWGTYRGNLYFGMRTRNPKSLLVGLMWYSTDYETSPKVRHYCSLDDSLDSWGWIEHDGESYGKQIIVDSENNARISILYSLTQSDSWIVKIKVSPIVPTLPVPMALITYIADENCQNSFKIIEQHGVQSIIKARQNDLFDMSANIPSQLFMLKANPENVWDANGVLLPDTDRRISNSQQGNFLAAMYHLNSTLQLQMSFNGGAPRKIPDQSRQFNRKFHKIFKGLPKETIPLTKFALSNMLGSISYFYGSSYVLSDNGLERKVSETEPFELFTDIPSRPTFPRGFLWDSGFHNLLISEWSPSLSLEILRSWAGRIEHSGWVAREQVPGSEARRAVPVGYIIQNTKHANPPALLMSIHKLAIRANKMANTKESQIIKHELNQIVNQFEKNLKWLIRTQRGQVHPHFCNLMKGTRSCCRVLKLPAFRWRGRTKHHNLNSGLDDYPRGDFPNRFELHLDLACWVAYGSKTFLQLYDLLGVKGHLKQKKKFKKLHRQILFSLEHLHWDSERQVYSDITIGTDGGLIHTQHLGYVNLFPLILGLTDPKSPKLKATLDLIENPDILWTRFGLRSLSRKDHYYMKGDQYWTGPIWININYLVLSSLKRIYVNSKGPYSEQARRVYQNLRSNILMNMVKSFNESNTIWEQYSDVDGHGMRSRPFTGWSSLIILIASEIY